jgi:hypothetical protein
MIRASVPRGWRVGDKTGRSGNGANNDIGIVQPPTGGPIFLVIYVTAPDASPEARDNVVAEAVKVPIAALTRPAGPRDNSNRSLFIGHSVFRSCDPGVSRWPALARTAM